MTSVVVASGSRFGKRVISVESGSDRREVGIPLLTPALNYLARTRRIERIGRLPRSRTYTRCLCTWKIEQVAL